MCGRTCLTLSPEEICTACGKDNKKLEWRPEPNLGRRYEGHIDNKGYNTTPFDVTPVLVSSHYFTEDQEHEFSPVVVPMLWGIIPSYHKGDYRKHGLTTNNCRLEGIQNSRIYKPLLKRGQRCVVLCEGFYEWQTVTGAKSSERNVYYIHFPQEKGVKMEDKATWNELSHLKLFKCAGLFDVWYDENGDSMYNYTVITFESDKTLGWLHHRTPAVLETEQQVNDWLDYRRVPEEEALKLLIPPKSLVWYQVSKKVNSSRNKSMECNKPLSTEKTPKSKLMQQWLMKSPKKTDGTPKEEKTPEKHEDPHSSGTNKRPPNDDDFKDGTYKKPKTE